jgi:hypothetical protein
LGASEFEFKPESQIAQKEANVEASDFDIIQKENEKITE